ncbi:glyoxalase [Mycobacterium colombiense]|uniref:Glyoxalase n=2 Tax=Mycobacterium colombiense TaxID=339268 RepID=A0A1A2RIS6_9MYCO|nr:glyoxalase [Mycobacterium colombiense]
MITAMDTDASTFPAHPLFEHSWPAGEYRFFQLGHVVDDVLAAAARWAQVFGIGPFHVMPVAEQRATYGQEVRTVRIQVAVAQAGPVQIELIQQHCDTPSIYRQWSRAGSSSFHQIATVTNNYDEKKSQFEAGGFDVVESISGKSRVAYVDTVSQFGFYTEIIEYRANFLTQLAAIAKSCAGWDGTDPVRLLTRNGYRVPGR